MNLDLVNFLSDVQFYQYEKDLFISLDQFLAQYFGVQKIIFLSIPLKSEVFKINEARSIFTRMQVLDDETKQTLEKMFTLLAKNYYTCSLVNQSHTNLLSLGEKGSQRYYAFFESSAPLDSTVASSLHKYSIGNMKIVAQFEELKKMQELIHIDDVTGLYNQRKLYKDLTDFINIHQKSKEPFSVLFVDLDHFKKVNDQYGHLVGTKLLEMVAKDIRSLLRDTDMVYRYGGDEFVLLLPTANIEAGKMVGERILKKVKSKTYDFSFKDDEKKLELSVSIGVAEYPSDAKSSEEVLLIADKMMYEAKGSGRGRVVNTQDLFHKNKVS